MDIPEIIVPEINAVTDLPQVAIPQAPPVTLDIGVPVINLPHFNPMDMEPEVEPQPVKLSRGLLIHQLLSHRRSSCRKKNNRHRRLHQQKRQSHLPSRKPLTQRVIEAIPTIPQAVNTAGTSAIAVSAALATPLLLKAIRPTIKKLAETSAGNR